MGAVILRDTREKDKKGWIFSREDGFEDTHSVKLDTGDYTIQGYEELICIERKGSLSEFVGNITQTRFFEELERLNKFRFSFLILEFNMSDVMVWPVNSGVPNSRISSKFILKNISEIQMYFNTKIIFAGKYGKEIARSIFKRVLEANGKKEES